MPWFLLLIAVMVVLMIAKRSNMTFDAAIKKFNGDPNWDKDLPQGKIEDLIRDDKQ